MKSIKYLAVLGMAIATFSTNNAWAEKCNGYTTSKALDPIVMQEAPDGSKVLWVGSEGIFIVLNPVDHPANLTNRICAGGMKIAPDGKSGAAVGSCAYTDKEGDVFHLNWQSGFAEGTWEIASGSGKFAGMTGNGMFWPSKRFSNLWGISTWEGECDFVSLESN